VDCYLPCSEPLYELPTQVTGHGHITRRAANKYTRMLNPLVENEQRRLYISLGQRLCIKCTRETESLNNP
jgi:hypothetical protein